MALDNYVDFQAAIADHLVRTDLTSQIQDCVTLFEAEAAFELFRMRGNEKVTIIVPTAPAAVTITGAANNGSGLIRLTLTSNSTFTTGQEVMVTSVLGTTEANASWIITKINDGVSVDLQNSVFTNTYTGGGTIQGIVGTCPLPSDYLGWRRATWTGSPPINLEYVHPTILITEFPVFLPLVSVDVPRAFTIQGSTFYVMPQDTTPIEFEYWAMLPALRSNLNWLFTNNVDCYWAGVLAEIYMYVKDYEQAAIWQMRKKGIYERIKTQRFRENGNMAMRISSSAYGATP